MLSGEVELDDFYLAARDRTKKREAGRGTDEQPMVCAVERRAKERGRCVIRVVPDCSGKTYKKFAEEHLDRAAHVRSDGWGGIAAGLKGWEGLDQRKFDGADADASLPTVEEADGVPTLTATGTPPPDDLVVQPLVRGTGTQVNAGDVITVQYGGFAWDDGALFDSTWQRGLPVSFLLSDVPPWAEGLVDQPTGSRVMLVVPPSYPLGVTDAEELAGKTVVFVIDILATGAPAQATP